MRFVKKDFHCIFPSVEDDGVIVRENLPQENGSVHVCFKKVSSSELSAKVMDPRVVTLTRLIQNNEIIEPGNVGTLLDLQDKESIENLAGSIGERAFKYIQDNNPYYNSEKNILEKPIKEEEK